jgi:hypothetical protein
VKTINKQKDVATLSFEHTEQLHRECRERNSQEGLEALDRMFTLSQVDPVTFHNLWIQPLWAAGLSFEAIIACIVDSYLWPN